MTISNKREFIAFVRSLPKLIARGSGTNTRIGQRLLDAAAREVLKLFRESFQDRMQGNTDETGMKWEPLKEETLKRKAKDGKPRDILVDTGKLYRSLGKEGELIDSLVEVRNGEIVISAKSLYAKYHHFGTKHLPQRPLWPDADRWPASWWQRISEAMQKELKLALKEALRS